MAKKIDPKAKAKRQKIYVAVGGVILLGVLAFQVPRTMKMLHPQTASSSSSSTPAATTPTSTTPIAAPSLSGGNATASVASSAGSGGDGLADPDVVPAPASGQLLAFGLFRTKDPFRQQLEANGPTGASGVTAGTKKQTKQPKGPTGATGAKTSGGSTPSAPPVRVVPTTAVISVNGSPESVRVAGTFPSSDPIFKLVSLTAKTARVGIAGGSLESGSAAVTLQRNKPVTLLNTADGTRYVLRLLSIS
jgi:hypothetical protein